MRGPMTDDGFKAFMWCGRPIEELTHEELLEAFRVLLRAEAGRSRTENRVARLSPEMLELMYGVGPVGRRFGSTSWLARRLPPPA